MSRRRREQPIKTIDVDNGGKIILTQEIKFSRIRYKVETVGQTYGVSFTPKVHGIWCNWWSDIVYVRPGEVYDLPVPNGTSEVLFSIYNKGGEFKMQERVKFHELDG